MKHIGTLCKFSIYFSQKTRRGTRRGRFWQNKRG